MEYDSAAARSTINSVQWASLGKPNLRPTTQLSGYTHVPLKTLGDATVHVRVGGKDCKLVVIVMDNTNAIPLFGLDWMNAFEMLPKDKNVTLHAITTNQANHQELISKIFKDFPALFSGEIGCIKNYEVTIHLKNDAVPKIMRARPVPFALLPAVNDELDRMINEGVLEAVDPLHPIEWASPIVITERKDGRIRIVGDFKPTVNPCIRFHPYPHPTFEEAATKLSGSTIFSLVDLKDAFLQLMVDEKSRQYLIIVTHRGYFQFRRLGIGLSVAPTKFQEFMDSLLHDLEGIAWVKDDIAVCGKNLEEHLKNLYKLLERLESVGLRTQQCKVKLLVPEIEFLGFRINSLGIQPIEDKISAIKEMKNPENQTELRSFIGSINQYSHFIPNLQSIIQPLNRLLKKNARWLWTEEDSVIFEKLKSLITADDCVAHYSLDKPIVLITDASERGLGAALVHQEDDGSFKLVAAAWRTLSDTEKNYSTIDREAAAIIFAVGKFELFLKGRHFTLLCDHKPLERIFSEKSEVPKLAASRLVRWAIVLSAFQYTIKHIEGKTNYLADILSRKPLQNTTLSPLEIELEEEVVTLKAVRERTLDNLVLSQRNLKNKTLADPILAKVIGYIKRGWTEKRNLPSDVYFTFFEKREELYLEEDLIFGHDRIVIPTSLREEVTYKLHETHLGVNAMKSLARSAVWWPNCDKSIEKFSQDCDTCQKYAQGEPETPLCLWNTPSKAWERIHIDYTGPYEGKYWFVVIDGHSRWLEIFPLNSPTSTAAIRCLRTLVARYGVCRYIVSDNGTHFTSNEFQTFCKSNGIRLIQTTPYHSRSNGRVERAIRTFKWRFSKSSDQFPDFDHRLQNMLFAYRTTVHTSTGKTPAELFLQRNVLTFFDVLKPSAEAVENSNALKQKLRRDEGRKERSFTEGDSVLFKRKVDEHWKTANITSKTGPLSYRAVDDDGVNVRLHADHIRRPIREKRPPTYLMDYST